MKNKYKIKTFLMIFCMCYYVFFQLGNTAENQVSDGLAFAPKMDEAIFDRIIDDIRNVNDLITYHINSYDRLDYDLRDKYFVLFYRYFSDIVEVYNKHCIDKIACKSKLSQECEYGIIITSDEWGDIAVVSCAFLEKHFKGFVSQRVNDFLSMRAEEQKKQFQHDRSLKISWEELGDRCLNWENHLKEFPNSPLLNEINELRRIYLSSFLVGLSQSRILHFGFAKVDKYEREDLQIVLDTYQQFILKYPESDLAELLRKYVPLLKESDFLYNTAIWDFLRVNGIPSYRYADYKLHL